MAFNISSFKTNIADSGFLQTNRFEVMVTPPPVMRNKALNNLGTSINVNTITQLMTFRCESARLPGVNLTLNPNARYGIGPNQNFVHNAEFKDTQICLLADGYGDIYQFWYQWIRACFQHNGVDSATVGQSSQLPSYTAAYKDDYAGVISINVYDAHGNGIMRVNLNQAFPFCLDEVPLNWGDNNNLMRLNVGLTFKDYTLVGSTMDTNAVSSNRVNVQTDQSIIQSN